MTVHEFGNKDNPVILLLPGTMCYWKGNFGGVIDELAKDFFVAAVAYTGSVSYTHLVPCLVSSE